MMGIEMCPDVHQSRKRPQLRNPEDLENVEILSL